MRKSNQQEMVLREIKAPWFLMLISPMLLLNETVTAQFEPIQYPWPQRSYGKTEADPVYTDRWFLNSSKITRPLDIEYGNFNYHLEGGNPTFRNIQTMSFGICFPYAIKEKYQRDEILKYTDFINLEKDFNGYSTKFKGYEFSAVAAFDMLGWKFVSFSLVYGISFGQRKLVSFIDGSKYKLRNPFFGLLAGSDVRFNLFKNSGISLGGFCYYMHDVSKPKWINRQNYPFNLPEKGRFTGWQWGLGISFAINE